MEANAGEYIKNYLHLKRFPRISLHCKLVSVQYWEYEYGLLGLNKSFYHDMNLVPNKLIMVKFPPWRDNKVDVLSFNPALAGVLALSSYDEDVRPPYLFMVEIWLFSAIKVFDKF